MGCGNQAIPSLGWLASDQGFQNYILNGPNIILRPMADCRIFWSRRRNVRILYVNNNRILHICYKYWIQSFAASLCLSDDVIFTVPLWDNKPVLIISSWTEKLCVCLYIYIYIYIYIYFAVGLRPDAGHGLLILEVSRSHTTTHHNR